MFIKSMILYGSTVYGLWSYLANMTRELLKANNGANPATFKEFIQVTCMFWTQQIFALKLNPWGIPTNPGKLQVLVLSIMQEKKH